MTLNLAAIRDIRQSEGWTTYLHNMGWHAYRTSGGVNVEIRPSLFGGLVKVQKPRPLLPEDIVEIEKIAFEHKPGLIKIEPYIGQNEQFLIDTGYVPSKTPLTPTATYLIDLTLSEEQLWNNLSHSAKYSINRAKREGASIEIVKHPDEHTLKKFYEILCATGKRKKFFIPSFTFTHEQARAFGDNGYLFISRNAQGEICGEKWHVGDGKFVLYVSGGTTAKGLEDKSGYLLVWESILFFKKLGYQVLDLEGKYDGRFPGITKHWGGFSNFKEKFGAIPVEFPLPRIKHINLVIKTLSKIPYFDL